MKTFIEHIRTSIYLIMCALFTILIYIYLDEILLKSSDTWLLGSLIIIGIVLLDYLSRRFVTNFFLFFTIHLLLIAGAIFIPTVIMDKIILGFTAFSYLLLAIGFWKTESNERSLTVIDIPLGLTLFFVLIYLHASISKSMSDEVATYAYLAGIAYFILFFVREYLSKFLSYSLRTENFSKELQGTFTTNFSLIMLFNAVVVFAIMVANMFFSDSTFNVIGRFFRFLARKFFGFLTRFSDTEKIGGEKVVELPTGQGTTVSNTSVSTPSNTDSSLGSILFKIFMAAILIGLTLLVFYIIYSFIKQYLHRNSHTDDVIEKTNFKDKRQDVQTKVPRSARSIFPSNREKLRKLYTEKINSVIKLNNKLVLKESDTTAEIQHTVLTEESVDKQNMLTLTALYRKARYSNAEITKADVDSAKKSV